MLTVDIKGSELDVFADAVPWIEPGHRIVFKAHDKHIDDDHVQNTLHRAGFRQIPPRVPDPEGINPVELYVKA